MSKRDSNAVLKSLCLVQLFTKENEMLVHSLYEKVANTISQANLSKLSRSQTDWLEEELSRLSAEKQGDIDEIGYDEIIKAFNRAKSR